MYAAIGPAPRTVRTSRETLQHTVRHGGSVQVQDATYTVGSATAQRKSARAYSLTSKRHEGTAPSLKHAARTHLGENAVARANLPTKERVIEENGFEREVD